MPVMIEELQAEVAAPPAAAPAPEEAPAAQAPDGRELLELVARELWCLQRLLAD